MLDNQTNKGQHQYAYTYDYVGNRLDMTVTNAGGVGIHLYSYDDIYQITEVNYPDSLSYLATDTQFHYDAAGNRTSVIDGGGTCNYTTNNLNQYTAAGPTNFSYDSSGNMTHDANYAYYYDPENRLIQVTKSGGPTDLAAALDSFLTYTTGGAASWTPVGGAYAQSGYINHNQESWMQAQVEGPGTLTFQWKVSSEAGCDQLQFYLDGDLQDAIDGEQDWDEMSYQVTGSGTHTFRWRYQKDYSLSEGEDAGYVDQVQWTGPLPEDPPADRWHHLTYVYDPAGRRIEKQYDYDTVLKYVYDGDHCIAEYDAGGNLRRKYIYGPAVDEPIAMIEATQTYAGTYYYHFDALGSCVALTDSDANTADVYEYDVYGRVGMLDANHPNRFLFTGREYDKETGLYYYRARYYNPQIGRFLQTDPKGYTDGMNLYRYCTNSPIVFADPDGTEKHRTPADLSYMDPGSDNYNKVLSRFCPQPSQWAVDQYFWWYLLGDGAKVDLGNTGLLTHFQNDADVQKDIAEFEKQFLKDAREGWLRYIDEGGTDTYEMSGSTRIEYSFDSLVDWAKFLLSPRGANLLIILGDGTFSADAEITVETTGNYVATFTYYVADVFHDPDPFNKYTPFSTSSDWEGCTPYVMEGEWSHTVTGSFKE